MTTHPTTFTTNRAHAPAYAPATTVAVLGLGYVGLPTALALAASGTRVLGIDISARRRADISAGDVDLLDGDHRRLQRHLGRELICTEDAAALAGADTVIVCVPTPVDADSRPDLRALRAACVTVLEHVRAGQLLILTSTSYVGSTRELLVEPLASQGLTVGRDVFVAFAPERIDPGNAVHPQETVPRVVGGATPDCLQRAAQILGQIAPIHPVTSPEAAELTKLHENTFRAINIAYSYELARAATVYGLDACEIIDAAASKPFGFMPFYPGAGVGGHCIPCDPHYLLEPLNRRGVASPMIASAMEAIAQRPKDVVRRALELLDDRGIAHPDARVLVVGAAYKPGVADMRESPAVHIIGELLEAGVQLGYHDPMIPTLELDGRPLVAQRDPEAVEYDLIVLVCVHPTTEQFWRHGDTPVLDCTYRTLTYDDPRREIV
jgi:UDP-N-acetyl-D-glucosamine dehydrogenase